MRQYAASNHHLLDSSVTDLQNQRRSCWRVYYMIVAFGASTLIASFVKLLLAMLLLDTVVFTG